MSLLPYISQHSLSLLTDFYQLTMAYGYWKSQWHTRRSVFHYFFRKKPFQGEYAVTAGLESLVHFLEKMQFTQADLDYLEGLKNVKGNSYFDSAFLQFLATFRFRGDVWAIKEGTVVFPYEPLIRVEATLIECQLIETILLNLMNFPTLIATKAARICHAAGTDPVLEFGLRRAQGIDGAMSASRAAFIGGCSATSNVLAGKMFGIPVQGTHAHSWIMAIGIDISIIFIF